MKDLNKFWTDWECVRWQIGFWSDVNAMPILDFNKVQNVKPMSSFFTSTCIAQWHICIVSILTKASCTRIHFLSNLFIFITTNIPEGSLIFSVKFPCVDSSIRCSTFWLQCLVWINNPIHLLLRVLPSMVCILKQCKHKPDLFRITSRSLLFRKHFFAWVVQCADQMLN